jgi:glyoxylase-like metal-dependent hydrolase (beta-lactamase superfamily II)
MKIGDARLRPVLELADHTLPALAVIADFTPADLAPHAGWMCPHHVHPHTHEMRLSMHAWLIEADGKRILVDPCVGHHRPRPFMPHFDMMDSPLMDNLAAMGVTPESIDYVFCTHLHFDHVGWNTREKDGRYVPTFPNARYIFSRAEDAYWRRELTGELPQEDLYNSRVYVDCVEPVFREGLGALVDEGDMIAGCITFLASPGHTIGHMAGVLDAGREGAVLAGDALHHPIQVLHPDRPFHSFDDAQARTSRRRLLELCVDKDYWLAPAHFRAPHVCKVRRQGDAYRIEWPES